MSNQYTFEALPAAKREPYRWSVLGLLIAVVVTGANSDDGTAAPLVIERMAINDFPRMQVIFGDNKYNNKSLNRWMERERPAWSIEVQKPPQGRSGLRPNLRNRFGDLSYIVGRQTCCVRWAQGPTNASAESIW